ncbi:unnamed protein product (macronuclear) [Paramecium tetraurelia]|uniref:Transmembrane protein n=1 Tax=Paramecium tetraurelia TaxID=5888 RepID=A0BNQ5_PARTE|nr:uncharacterized protein GSPATT00030811001 [Paramecium tetraurelia]CAK60172.1 unnamed protein product [Paramecium tetraurelia]|eukprot:XP_001427570.1 hypothetical protein (macronuclear) [Paramecium tetraurelia strain d4-2]
MCVINFVQIQVFLFRDIFIKIGEFKLFSRNQTKQSLVIHPIHLQYPKNPIYKKRFFINYSMQSHQRFLIMNIIKDIKKCLISEQHDSFDILMQNNQVSYIFNFDLYTKSFPNIQVQLPFVPQEKISLYSHIYVYVLIIRLRIKEFRTYVLLNNIKQFNFIIENRIQNLLLKIVIPDNIVISQKKRIIFFEFIGIKRLC